MFFVGTLRVCFSDNKTIHIQRGSHLKSRKSYKLLQDTADPNPKDSKLLAMQEKWPLQNKTNKMSECSVSPLYSCQYLAEIFLNRM